MEMKKQFYIERCPSCGSSNVVQIAWHDSHGHNGFICKDCNCNFGN